MSAKYKHKKNKNVAFLYEVLVLELTKSIISKDRDLRLSLLETLQTYFNKDTILGKELKVYKAILQTENVDEITAEKIIQEAKKECSLLDNNTLNEQHSSLFFKMKSISPNIFLNFVPNYKDLASISQVFNKDLSIKTRVLLENEIMKKMTSQLIKENKMVPIDNLVLNSFIKRYNEQYSVLKEEQKTLLNKYITSFNDNGMDLKIYLNEEIKRLKTEINKSLTIKEFQEDQIMLNNVKEVVTILENYSKEQINEEMIKQIIKIQNLVREINEK